MITIIDAVERKNSKGETFTSLILSGGVEMVKSQNNKFYATVRKCSVPSTLDLPVAKSMIGEKMSGSIIKKPCEPYIYTTPKGEDIELEFTYEFVQETSNYAETILG
jgi:hypothetical protein